MFIQTEEDFNLNWLFPLRMHLTTLPGSRSNKINILKGTKTIVVVYAMFIQTEEDFNLNCLFPLRMHLTTLPGSPS